MRDLRAPTTVAPAVGCTRGLAEVRLARGVGGDLVADALELAAANVLKILPLGRRGRGFVKVNRNLKSPGDLGADVLGHGNAVFDGDAVNGDEGHHIGCTHARMRALMLGQVDQFRGFADAANRRFLNRFALADQRDDAAVVIGVHLAVEEIDAGNLHGLDDGINFGGVAAFREVGHAFN